MRKGFAIGMGAVVVAGLASLAGARSSHAAGAPEGCIVDGGGATVPGAVESPACAYTSTISGENYEMGAGPGGSVTLTYGVGTLSGTTCSYGTNPVTKVTVTVTGPGAVSNTSGPITSGLCVAITASGASEGAVGTITGQGI